MSDLHYMETALLLAERGRGRTSPNPMVGALVVSPDGVVVGRGHHDRAGQPHAEVIALRQAGDRARGATLYCTLEPCCHVGRTGPCAPRVCEAGIARVVAAMTDPNPLVASGGFDVLRAHGVRVEVGVGRESAEELNRAFITWVTRRRPFVVAKAAVSLDGFIAAAPGVRTALTSPPALTRAQMFRAEMDAIAVGSGTVLADDPLLTVREVYRARPFVRVIFDRRLRISPRARVFSTLAAGPVLVFTLPTSLETDRARALADAGARLEAVEGDLRAALARLGALNVTSLLLEGGATMHAAAWDAGVVDYVQWYLAPTAVGRGGVRLLPGREFSTVGLVGRRIEACGPDVVVEGYVHRTD
jgi:diaminohydroxyphosphoribosylaminopyrimidine deaminase/5-amino-6-(5-phosphoribosylamino)uracil reductase